MSKRVSLILKNDDVDVIVPYLTEGSAASEVLNRWAQDQGLGEVQSEASALRALLQAGASFLQDRALDIGYGQLAEEFNDPAADDDRRVARERYIAHRESRS